MGGWVGVLGYLNSKDEGTVRNQEGAVNTQQGWKGGGHTCKFAYLKAEVCPFISDNVLDQWCQTQGLGARISLTKTPIWPTEQL